jgi:nucleoid DNA-binding protein
MIVTQEMLVKQLSEKSGYYQKDVRTLLHCLNDVVLEYFDAVTDEEDISIQLVQGVKIGCKVMPERTRKDPRDQSDIICVAQTKPFAKFSQNFRDIIQKQYEFRKDG